MVAFSNTFSHVKRPTPLGNAPSSAFFRRPLAPAQWARSTVVATPAKTAIPRNPARMHAFVGVHGEASDRSGSSNFQLCQVHGCLLCLWHKRNPLFLNCGSPRTNTVETLLDAIDVRNEVSRTWHWRRCL